MIQVETGLAKWIFTLDKEIQDRYVKIKASQAENQRDGFPVDGFLNRMIEVHADLVELLACIERGDIPNGAVRSIGRCLQWSPYAK